MADVIKKGHIYKLYSLVDPDDFYIGSTFNELRVRFQDHKRAYKQHQNRLLYKLMNEIGLENFKIVEIEPFEGTRTQRLRREGELIRSLKPNLNMVVAGRSDAEYWRDNKDKKAEKDKRYRQKYDELVKQKKMEYRNSHKEQIAERDRRYRETNRDMINQKKEEYRDSHQEKITCECGSIVGKLNYSTHLKTPKHLNIMKGSK